MLLVFSHVTAFRFYFVHSTFTSNPLENHENVSPIFKDLNWAQVTHWFDSRNDRLKLWIFFCNLQAYSTHHLPDHATINIQISDANDNPPTFSAKYYSFSIKENAGIGAIVGEVKASDVDQVSSSSFVFRKKHLCKRTVAINFTKKAKLAHPLFPKPF